MADKLQGQRDTSAKRRRPTSSIAWDSLNRSQENSPQHELAAIPFKWEEAPGKRKEEAPGKPKQEAPGNDKTKSEAAERAMARRILQGVERSHRREMLLQKKTAAQIVAESICDQEEASSAQPRPQEFRALGEISLHGSFRSSHRFYARTSSAALGRSSSFQGLRLSADGGGHVISEVETEAHIDLVAPAAAKFLVESCISPTSTPEQNLTRIPFKWEEAPGKPKFDDAADTMPKKLQLPPRLVAPPTQKVDSMSQDLRGRQRQRSMSGPLLGHYPPVSSNHTSPGRTRPHQHSHSVMRSCSPSKRAVSPSKLQALAKHLSRKVSSTTAGPESLDDEQNWHGARRDPSPLKRSISPSKIQVLAKHLSFKVSNTGSARNQGSYEEEQYWQTRNQSPSKSSISPSKMQAFDTHLSHKVSGTNTVTQESSYEDQIWAARNSSPFKRSISPSKIQALAKHLSRKISNSIAPESSPYEDPNWQPRNNPRHSYISQYHSGPLEGYHNRTKGGAGGYGNFSLESNSSGAVSLRVNSEQDYSWPARHNKASGPGSGLIGYHSGPLESSTTSSKRSISPSLRSISPSRIHSLAKQLTRKVMPRQETAPEDLKLPTHANSWRHSFTTCDDSSPLERQTDKIKCSSSFSLERSSSEVLSGPPSRILQSSELTSSEPWLDKHQQGQPSWSPTSIFHGPNGNSQVPTSSAPSSGSDIDTQTHMTTPPSITLSKSLSRISYESFEQCFEEHNSPTSSHPAQWDADSISPVGSPYLGPISADYTAQEPGGQPASEGVKAILKLCKAGSSWRKSKNHQNPEIWAPTLATYFQEQSANRSGQLNTQDAVGGILHPDDNKTEDTDLEDSSPVQSPEAPTRLPYIMPSVVEQEMAGREHYDSLNTDYASCLGVKLSPARFISRGENRSCSNDTVAWADRIPVASAPTKNSEDGFRSPAYAATLELLSPSRELILKKKNLGKLQGIAIGLPSANIHKKTQFIVRFSPDFLWVWPLSLSLLSYNRKLSTLHFYITKT